MPTDTMLPDQPARRRWPGKRSVSMNALRHGLSAETAVLPDEDPSEYAALCNDLVQELRPSTVIEEQLVDQLCKIFWKLKRAGRADRELSISHLCHFRIRIEKMQRESAALDSIGLAPCSDKDRQRRDELLAEADKGASMSGRMMMSAIDQLEVLNGYEAMLEKRLYRLLNELRNRQGQRIEEAI